MLLAADAGATKTWLGLFAPGVRKPEPVRTRIYPTRSVEDFGDLVAAFLDECLPAGAQVAAACFGVAGPITGPTACLTNVPWVVDAAAVRARFGIPHISLLNDLEAMAYAVPVLAPSELEVLQTGEARREGAVALIAAGTGLGEASLHRVDSRLVPSASEAGHADFAARTPVEIRLLQELTRAFGRVDVEHIVSGPGLARIHRMLHPEGCADSASAASPADIPARISAAAISRRCPRCVEALEVFVSAYGAEAGNLALRTLATGGVYIGGGIAPKILPALKAGPFLDAFRAKAPMEELLASIPVCVILSETAALLGAAVRAASGGDSESRPVI